MRRLLQKTSPPSQVRKKPHWLTEYFSMNGFYENPLIFEPKIIDCFHCIFVSFPYKYYYKERGFTVSPYECDFPLRVWYPSFLGNTLTQVCVLRPAVRQVTPVTLQTGSLFDCPHG
jgi:hypothetical protein